MPDPLANILWTALDTAQRHLALSTPLARKYQPDIAPFAALAEDSSIALHELHSLMSPGEALYLIAEQPLPPTKGLQAIGSAQVAQMLFPDGVDIPAAPSPAPEIHALTCAEAPEMLTLIAIAFPGFFRQRTCTMGPYAGIRVEGQLVAMAGDRMAIAGLREISAVCTHPAFTGQGFATHLLLHKLSEHRAAALQSFLHTAAGNARAIALYERLGFQHTRQITMQRLRREA